MNHAIQMGSGAMIYICFVKIDSAVQKLIGGIRIQTHRQQGDFISLLSFFFFQNKESRVINVAFDFENFNAVSMRVYSLLDSIYSVIYYLQSKLHCTSLYLYFRDTSSQNLIAKLSDNISYMLCC
jgi:hypothetical protein